MLHSFVVVALAWGLSQNRKLRNSYQMRGKRWKRKEKPPRTPLPKEEVGPAQGWSLFDIDPLGCPLDTQEPSG
jgi:hypothetical protein